eukprot:CAMPEP_0194710688 /NCGR_PEP_ID=MMETSP0296-20130528/3229_1 /TAXON_ID=39354 /ORGANISM="Heterosigma akashiwo, Strain CCMP2393" /LENGTH=142 /DNA_ID=CAMNT_0039608501 /DNA_START=273 /DNA_END=701 /DNA_ORIENTATION=-
MAPLDCNSFVTVWIPLQPVPARAEGGTALTFAAGSHRDFALAYWQDPHAGRDLEGRYEIFNTGKLDLGDATWHHGWTLHSAPENTVSGSTREAIAISFIADGTKVLSDEAGFSPDDEDSWSFEAWLNEIGEDRIIDHSLVPL